MHSLSRIAAVTVVVLAQAAYAPAQDADKDKEKEKEPRRPQLSLRANPTTGMVPVRVSATAEFKGGDDDFQEYYCPSIEWNWGDGTVSESSNDCDPYEAGKSQIRRRYIASHAYNRSGAFRISFRLKNRDKVLTSTSAVIRLLGGGF